MSTDPYDHETDRTFDQIIQHQQQRHPGGRTMNQPPRTSRDQAALLLGCGGFLLMLGLAVAVIIIAWTW